MKTKDIKDTLFEDATSKNYNNYKLGLEGRNRQKQTILLKQFV